MFSYKGKLKNVTVAVTQANAMLFDKMFYVELERLKAFDMSNATNKLIIQLINKHKMDDIHINVYKPWYRWSKAIAYYSKKKPYVINLNYYKVKKMNKFSITGTLWHEFIHYVDGAYNDLRFGHGSNSRKGKSNTAPYRIGKEAKVYSTRMYGV